MNTILTTATFLVATSGVVAQSLRVQTATASGSLPSTDCSAITPFDEAKDPDRNPATGCGGNLSGSTGASGNQRWVSLGLTNAATSAAGFFAIGYKKAEATLPGSQCKLLVDVWGFAPFVTSAAGTASHSFTMKTALKGTVYVQDVLLVFGKQSLLFTGSNGLTLEIGRGPQIVEDFATSAQLDTDVSAGAWSRGKGLAPQIGGTGVHGAFDARHGKLVEIRQGNQIVDRYYEWNTDAAKIPATATQSGQDEIITNGVFHFTQLVIDTNTKVVFTGQNPAVLHVRGKCQIDGQLLVNGQTMGSFTSNSDVKQLPGQPGGVGGAGGAFGGAGGKACDGKGPLIDFNGKNGSDVALAAGHAYATQAIGSGGKGSLLYPISGKIGAGRDDFDGSGVFAAFTAPGGAGGSFAGLGTSGMVSKVPPAGSGSGRKSPAERIGPASAPGSVFDIAALSPKTSSLGHFLVGGAGGGGGGSHPLLMFSSSGYWRAGAGGAGGGGALALRIGNALAMKSGGLIAAMGGNAATFDGIVAFDNVPAPGGGGSGGTILLQVGGTVGLLGKVNVSGGLAGVTDNAKSSLGSLAPLKTEGGAGGSGYVRLETIGGASLTDLGVTVPASGNKNIGKLTDSDSRTASQSRFYATGLSVPPKFTSYVLSAKIDGVRRVYSDIDLSATDKDYVGRASSTQPVWIRFQGAKVSASGVPDQTTLGPWREFVTGDRGVASINKDQATGFRFLVIFDRSKTKTIELTKLVVDYCK